MTDSYIGEIRMFAGVYAPEGWAFCDGRLLSISEYDTLFMLIGTTYGGDGQTTFALPDLRGRVPVHQGTNPFTGSSYSLGQLAGTESVTLTPPQMPNHTHGVAANAAAAETASVQNQVWSVSGAKSYTTVPPSGNMNPGSVSPAGGSQPHENMMPFLTTSFIISLYGIYPSEN